MNEITLSKEQMNRIKKIYDKREPMYKDMMELMGIIFTDEKSTTYFMNNEIDKLEDELDKIWKEIYQNKVENN